MSRELRLVINNLNRRMRKHQKESYFYLLATIPFMVFMILTHHVIFAEFGLIFFALALYAIKQIVNVNEELITIDKIKLKVKSNNIRKIYPEGHHMIINPSKTILDLGGYILIGEDDRGTKIYQNIKEVVVLGEVAPDGKVIYDDYGIPVNLFEEQK